MLKATFVIPVNNEGLYAKLEKKLGAENCIPICDSESAAKALNRGIALTKTDIIVCCHQDVEFPAGWLKKLESQITIIGDKDFGVIGTFGCDMIGQYAGNVEDPHDNPKTGNLPCEAMSLDEHCLIIRKDSGLKFDETLIGWHFYGADICLEAASKGLKNYVIDARLKHLSPGKIDESFKTAKIWMLNKWSGRNPLGCGYLRTTCDYFPLSGVPSGQVWVNIPTGNRAKQVAECAIAWRDKGFCVGAFSWDDETTKLLEPIVDALWQGPMKSFATLHNWMALQTNWEVLICGADDLWPKSDVEEIYSKGALNRGKLIWVKDGLFNLQMTHPIITRQWYDYNGPGIFCEAFRHNCTDTDLFLAQLKKNNVVKCFDIDGFDHRHWSKSKDKPDKIYKIGLDTFNADMQLLGTIHKKVDLRAIGDLVPVGL